jgi:hypothetical protein
VHTKESPTRTGLCFRHRLLREVRWSVVMIVVNQKSALVSLCCVYRMRREVASKRSALAPGALVRPLCLVSARRRRRAFWSSNACAPSPTLLFPFVFFYKKKKLIWGLDSGASLHGPSACTCAYHMYGAARYIRRVRTRARVLAIFCTWCTIITST